MADVSERAETELPGPLDATASRSQLPTVCGLTADACGLPIVGRSGRGGSSARSRSRSRSNDAELPAC
jgi:hypothetical protein